MFLLTVRNLVFFTRRNRRTVTGNKYFCLKKCFAYRYQLVISAESLDHNKPPLPLNLIIELISFAVFTRDPVVKYILVKVLYIFRVVLKSFHPHKLPENRIFSNYVSSRQPRDSTVDQNGLLTQILKK